MHHAAQNKRTPVKVDVGHLHFFKPLTRCIEGNCPQQDEGGGAMKIERARQKAHPGVSFERQRLWKQEAGQKFTGQQANVYLRVRERSPARQRSSVEVSGTHLFPLRFCSFTISRPQHHKTGLS